MRVTIVGAGIAGLSTAWALARQGHTVQVFEQGPVPNPRGASVDQHRLIRSAYGASRAYTMMVDDAFAAWERMWADLGRRLYHETGVLAITSEGQDDWVRQSAETLAALGRPVDWMDQDAFERRYPLLTGDRMVRAFHLPTGGTLHAGAIVENLAHHLMGRGVPIRPHTAVASIDPDRARVVLADRAVVDADALVVATGAWSFW
jgi:glycine/D-amino acid oxidase-like deaminating enzyme